MRQNWHKVVQKTIFVLLLVNTCLLAVVVLPPLLGQPQLLGERAAPLLAMDLPVQQESGLLFGNIRLKTEQELTLSQALVFINGQLVGDFSAGSLLLRVYEGDVLSIDATAYERQLMFYLSAVSSNIESSALPPLISTAGSVATLPPVCFK